MSKKPSNAEHRKRLRQFSSVSYGEYRHAVDSVPCPVCGAGRYLACVPYASHGPHQLHPARLLLGKLIPVGESLIEPDPFWVEHKQEEFVREFCGPVKFRPYPKR